MRAPVAGDILILGLGVSGEAAATFFARQACAGADLRVTVLEGAVGEEQVERAEALKRLGVDVRLGATEVTGSWDLIVASPGIAPHTRLVTSARATGAPVVSEIELAFRSACSPFVAVTGTNGKTTVTSLIAHILGECGIPAEAVGNIGHPAIEAAAAAGCETVLVTEVSSFQLALTEEFHPRVSVLLNITPDHIDWHGSMEAYTADKAKVFANQGPDDVAVVDVDDEGSAPFADLVADQGVRVVRVSRHAMSPGGATVAEGFLTLDSADGPRTLLATGELAIRGQHNVSNALAAAAAAQALGADLEGIRAGLRSFAPIEHRLEPVEWVAGVEYFNDSKATNPDAVLKALTAFEDRPVVVLLGGRNKGNDFRRLARHVAETCRVAVIFGEARRELARSFAGLDVPVLEADTMLDAVQMAAVSAREGDVVLLSPACASFDEFRSYEERGRVFKDAVLALARRAREQ